MTREDTVITWERARELVNQNQLDKLYRSPATTAKYRAYKIKLKEQGMSIADYITKKCLKWVDKHDNIDAKPKSDLLFTDPSDIRIILNDFPYNFESNVTHICVWSKLRIPSNPESPLGDIDQATRDVLERYVQKNFIEHLKLDKENVIWFRNFPVLQSVLEISHIHVLIRDFDEDKMHAILGTSGLTLTQEEVRNARK